MKSLTQYLAENKKKYSFKIWLACDASKELCDKIKTAVESLEIDQFQAPKRLPIQRNNTYFPGSAATEISMIDFTVNYPATPPQIQALVYAAGAPDGCVVVQTALQGVGNTAPTDYMGRSMLLDPTLADDDVTSLTTNQQMQDLLRELESMAMIYAAPNKERAKTTNDLPQGTRSVMGHNKLAPPTYPKK
jgi:hypothetical protein